MADKTWDAWLVVDAQGGVVQCWGITDLRAAQADCAMMNKAGADKPYRVARVRITEKPDDKDRP